VIRETGIKKIAEPMGIRMFRENIGLSDFGSA